MLYFGARSGHGLWKSTDYGSTWAQVKGLPNVGKSVSLQLAVYHVHGPLSGTYVPDPTDTTGYNSDPIGLAWVTFDPSSGKSGSPTPRIFVGVVSNGTDNVFVSEDAGSTCMPLLVFCRI